VTRSSNLKFTSDTNKARSSMEKFPDHVEPLDGQPPYMYSMSPTIAGNGYANGPPAVDRWQPRRDSAFRGTSWNASASTGGRGHGRQKSLSDAFHTIRTRKASVSANVHEISDALKAPVSPRLIVRNSQIPQNIPHTDAPVTVDPLHYLVFVECPYQHLLEVYTQRVS
jgi:solute carrier family 35 protein E1